jgi:hypothetical protein
LGTIWPHLTLRYRITLVSFLRFQSLPPLSNTRNRTWSLAPVSYWSGIEMLAGMVCACLPALKALMPVWCGARGSRQDGNSEGYQRHSSPQISAGPRRIAPSRDPTLTFSENEDLTFSDRSGGQNSTSELTNLPKSVSRNHMHALIYKTTLGL